MNESWIKYTEDLHRVIFTQLSETREAIKGQSPEELTDIGWVLKQMYKNVDDIRKEIERLKKTVENLACLKSIEDEKVKLQGKLATGTPDVKTPVKVPHPQKQPEKWKSLCEFFGIPEEVGQNDLIRFHYPGLEAFNTERMSQGKPNLPGIDTEDVYVNYFLKYRGKKK